MSKPGKVLKALCKRLKVRLTVKRGKKRVYKSIKVLKAQCKRKAKKKKVKRKKKKVKRKKKKVKRKKKKVKRKRKFGAALAPPVLGRALTINPLIDIDRYNKALEVPTMDLETSVAQKILEDTNCCGASAVGNGCYEIIHPNYNQRIFITLNDIVVNGITYGEFFKCTNSGCYFNFTIFNNNTNNPQIYTKYHLTYHRSRENNAGNTIRHRIHIKYNQGYPGNAAAGIPPDASYLNTSNDVFNLDHTSTYGTAILGNDPANAEFSLILNVNNNGDVNLNSHPQQKPGITQLQPMNTLAGLFNCLVPVTLRCVLALDSIGEYMDF